MPPRLERFYVKRALSYTKMDISNSIIMIIEVFFERKCVLLRHTDTLFLLNNTCQCLWVPSMPYWYSFKLYAKVRWITIFFCGGHNSMSEAVRSLWWMVKQHHSWKVEEIRMYNEIPIKVWDERTERAEWCVKACRNVGVIIHDVQGEN